MTQQRRNDLLERCRRAIETGQPNLATIYGRRYLEDRRNEALRDAIDRGITGYQVALKAIATGAARGMLNLHLRALGRDIARLRRQLAQDTPPVTGSWTIKAGDWGNEIRPVTAEFHKSITFKREEPA